MTGQAGHGPQNRVHPAGQYLFRSDTQRVRLGQGLMFTTENAVECAQVLARYQNQGKYQPNDWHPQALTTGKRSPFRSVSRFTLPQTCRPLWL